MSKYKYMRLAEQLKSEIQTQALPPEKRIPTEDELVEKYGVSRNTVRQAVQMLVNDGYLIKIQGSGTFVARRLPRSERRGGETEKNNRCIGVVMNQGNSYIFPSVLMGISDYLLEHDYHMIIRMTFNEIATEGQVLAELLETGVSGFILEPARSAFPTVHHDLYRRIQERYPCVLLHASLPEYGFASIDNSNVEGFSMVVDYLAARGHRKIALLSKSDEQSGYGRFLGYARGLERNGIKLRESRIFWYVDEDFEEVFSDANAHRVKKAIQDCTAALCFNDDLARRFLTFLERHSIRVPEDLSVVGFDDMQQGQIIKPLTTIAHPKEKMGRAAAEAVLALIENPAADVSRRFEPVLIERQTVADIRNEPVAL